MTSGSYRLPHPPTTSRGILHPNRLRTWSLLSFGATIVGYLFEFVRQRGNCANGDPSPDTLVLSIYLILIGGGVGGLLVLVFGVKRFTRRHSRDDIAPLLIALVTLVMVEPLFFAADAGPGGWFQYCAS